MYFPGPYSAASALHIVTCADTRIGGAGGVPVLGLSLGQDALNHGLNKRVLVVPQGYGWANTVPSNRQPVCQVSSQQMMEQDSALCDPVLQEQTPGWLTSSWASSWAVSSAGPLESVGGHQPSSGISDRWPGEVSLNCNMGLKPARNDAHRKS